MEPKVSIHSVGPAHPGRGEPSYIEARIVLEHLKAQPVVTARLTPDQAVRLIEQLAMSIRITAKP